jgi:hypothetical protein
MDSTKLCCYVNNILKVWSLTYCCKILLNFDPRGYLDVMRHIYLLKRNLVFKNFVVFVLKVL